jgi:hypothetical protein
MVRDLVDDSFVKKAILNAGGPHMFDLIDTDDPWGREEVIEI